MQHPNPLSQFFRQPSIHIRLPSGGKFYPTGSLNMPPNQELPVLPMTAVDEITYRTPDALFNGSAIVSVIQSCIPSIRDAWNMPSTDIDAVLIAVRIASFGHGMDVNTACTSCGHQDEITVDLRAINDQIRPGEYDKSLSIGNLEFYFKPISYKDVNQNNQVQFEQQQALRILDDKDAEETVKLAQLNQSMKIMNDLTLKTVAQSIGAIKTPDALVTELNYIYEFLNNCNSQLFSQLRDHVISLKQASEIKPIDLTCSECSHKYSQPFTLDMASFFGDAS
jgi:T4 bacteriophage base plate protein